VKAPKKIYFTDGIFESNFPFNQSIERKNAFVSLEWLKEWIKENSEAYWVDTIKLLKAIEHP
jgi:hypothetical protein